MSYLNANIRIIPRLDIKSPHLIKSINFEGVRVLGDPNEFATRYYQAGADELLYVDAVASLYDRNNIFDFVKYTTENIFIPVTVCGGIRSLHDVEQALRSGADKVAINTAAIKRPKLIQEVADYFGSQCMVLSVEAKSLGQNQWEAYVDNGRERTGVDVMRWITQGVDLGAGELLITSVDREGTRQGFDTDLLAQVTARVNVPVIASGGFGSPDHLVNAVQCANVDAIAVADALHYGRYTIKEIKKLSSQAGVGVRSIC